MSQITLNSPTTFTPPVIAASLLALSNPILYIPCAITSITTQSLTDAFFSKKEDGLMMRVTKNVATLVLGAVLLTAFANPISQFTGIAALSARTIFQFTAAHGAIKAVVSSLHHLATREKAKKEEVVVKPIETPSKPEPTTPEPTTEVNPQKVDNKEAPTIEAPSKPEEPKSYPKAKIALGLLVAAVSILACTGLPSFSQGTLPANNGAFFNQTGTNSSLTTPHTVANNFSNLNAATLIPNSLQLSAATLIPNSLQLSAATLIPNSLQLSAATLIPNSLQLIATTPKFSAVCALASQTAYALTHYLPFCPVNTAPSKNQLEMVDRKTACGMIKARLEKKEREYNQLFEKTEHATSNGSKLFSSIMQEKVWKNRQCNELKLGLL